MATALLQKLVACATAIFLLLSSATSTSRQLSNAGTQFAVGIMNNLEQNRPMLYVTTLENRDISFSLSDGTTSLSYSVNSTGHVAIDLQPAGFTDGILISSDDQVSKLIVMGLGTIFQDVSGDTFKLFPIQEYPSYTFFAISIVSEAKNSMSFIHLIGTEDNTSVTVTPTQTLSSLEGYGCIGTAGQQCSFTINKLQTLILQSPSDLTGTKIVSNKPISVFSGHDCAKVPINVTANCKPVIEQIPPVVTWGKTFLVGPLLGHQHGEWYKIMAAEDNTNVNVYCVGPGVYSKTFLLPTEGSTYFFTPGLNRRCSIRGDRPLLVMLFATNDGEEPNTFMALVPPVKQYISPLSVTLEPSVQDNTVSITIPATSCPNSQCSVLVDKNMSVDVSSSSQPVYCSENEVCGYVLSQELSDGVHTLRLSTAGAMGVISYTDRSDSYGYGTVGSMALNHIAVDTPEVVLGYDGQLKTGEKLVLTCRVALQVDFGSEIETTLRWLKGEEDTELRTAPIDTQNDKRGSYIVNHTVETLSLEDSDVYRCEVTLRSDQAGVLATASDSMTISVVGFGYIQLQILGVPKCSDWLIDGEERVAGLTEEVADIISKGCNCDFSSAYISMPTLLCSPEDPDSTNILLYQAKVQQGGKAPIDYRQLLTILKKANGTSFSFKSILLTVGSSEKCGVAIQGFQPSPNCFTNRDISESETPSTGDVEGGSESNSGIIVAGVVGTCVVVALVLLGVILILVAVAKGRHQEISNQRPKSIHIHHRLPHGGDSVTSFGPADSGSPNSNIYVQKDSTPSSPTAKSTTFSIPENGIRNGTHSPPVDQYEQERNYKTMKANLSEVELLPSISHV